MNTTTPARRASDFIRAAIAALLSCTAFANTNPVATDDAFHARWGFGLPVLSNDFDADGDPLTIVAVTNGTKGGVSINWGQVYYYGGAGADGDDTFTYTIDDGKGGQATATVTLTNSNPVAVNDAFPGSAVFYGGLDVISNDADPNSEFWLESATHGAKGTTTISQAGTIMYLPGPEFDGNDAFTYTICDDMGKRATATVTLTNANPTPADDTFDSVATFWGTQGGLYVTDNDSDPDGDFIWVESTTDGSKGTTSVAPGGFAINYLPGPDFDGNDTFTYTIRDMAGGRASATVTLTNVNPVANEDTYDSGVTVFSPALNVMSNDTDPDGGWFWIESATDGAKGTTSILPSGHVVYLAGPSFDGNDTFTYTIADMLGGRATATVTLTNVNPVANDDTYDSVEIMNLGGLEVTYNDFDPNWGWFWVESTTNGAKGTTSISEFGRINYLPGPSFDGNDTFTYTIRDMVGGRATATVTLTNVNPVATNDAYDSVEIMNLGGLNVLSNDFDPNWGWFWVESTTNGGKGTTSISIDGRINYVPGPSFDGNDTFTYTIRDMVGGRATATVTLTNVNPVATNDTYDSVEIMNLGGLNVLANDFDPNWGWFWVEFTTDGGKGTTSISIDGRINYVPGPSFDGNDTFTYTIRDMVGGRATATVTLTNVNPVANDDTYPAAAIFEGGLNVLWNDTDPNWGWFWVESSSNGVNGSTNISPDGLINYVPGPGFNGNDVFTYTIRDMVGGRATATVTIINALPIPSDDVATTTEDVTAIIAVLGNDNDADLGMLSIQSVTQGANGQVTIEGSQVSYRPAANWSGTDSFTYMITDGFATATATVSVTVTPVNDLPVAVNDSATAAEDSVATIAVLSNDSDIEGDSLSVQSVGQAVHGVAAIAGSSVTYTPASNWDGTDTFTYTVSDGKGGTATAQVSFVVTPVNDAPIASNDTATITEDTVATVAALANDTDVDGDTVAIQSVTQGAHGSVAISGNSITYTPETNWKGADRFTYVISDGNGSTAQAEIAITVTAVNDAPAFTVNPFTKPDATIGVPYLGSIASSATDVDAEDTLSFSKVDGPAWLTVATGGGLSGVAPAGSSGINSFTVRATDAAGLSVDAILTIAASGSLPSQWASADIGGVGLAGGATESAGTFTVSGSGSGIGGAADAFHFVSDALAGDGEIRARITSLSNTNPLAKAGVMIRESLAAESRHAFMAISSSNGFVFAHRPAPGGAASSVPGPALNGAPNNWVRLTRSGTLITAYASADGASWTQVGTAVVNLASTVEIGLAVTSGDNSVLSTAEFDNVSMTPFPAPWLNAQIGAPGLAGSAEYFGSTYTLKGAGNLSGSADNIGFLYQSLSGDGEIKARIAAPSNTGSNARLGVMVRETLTTGARYAFMGIDGSSGYRWQRRNSTGGSTTIEASGSGVAPNLWVRIVRSGNTLYGYKSANGTTWTLVSSRNISMATNIYIGMVVASGSTSTLNSTEVDNVTVVP